MVQTCLYPAVHGTPSLLFAKKVKVASMPSIDHESQNKQALQWLKKQGFSVRSSNIQSIGSRERVDVIGFRNQVSCLIESKVSRSDFLADRKKPERNGIRVGVGLYRFYICPEGLLKPEDIPDNWGLLYSDGKKVVKEFKPSGNMWPSFGSGSERWKSMQHEVNIESENSILFSLCRRLSNNQNIEC